jgi:hypothetical protein
MRRSLAVLVLLLGALGLAACGADSLASTSTSAPASGSVPAAEAPGTTVAVVKDVLATEVDPPGGEGSTLTLMRYTIAPGAKLAPHIHPGVQLARIESGTLTYTIVSGTAIVTRAGGQPEPVAGPTTLTFGPGDAVAENIDMVHFGANEGDEPVVILATLLTGDGQDLAVPVTTTVPG